MRWVKASCNGTGDSSTPTLALWHNTLPLLFTASQRTVRAFCIANSSARLSNAKWPLSSADGELNNELILVAGFSKLPAPPCSLFLHPTQAAVAVVLVDGSLLMLFCNECTGERYLSSSDVSFARILHFGLSLLPPKSTSELPAPNCLAFSHVQNASGALSSYEDNIIFGAASLDGSSFYVSRPLLMAKESSSFQQVNSIMESATIAGSGKPLLVFSLNSAKPLFVVVASCKIILVDASEVAFSGASCSKKLTSLVQTSLYSVSSTDPVCTTALNDSNSDGLLLLLVSESGLISLACIKQEKITSVRQLKLSLECSGLSSYSKTVDENVLTKTDCIDDNKISHASEARLVPFAIRPRTANCRSLTRGLCQSTRNLERKSKAVDFTCHTDSSDRTALQNQKKIEAKWDATFITCSSVGVSRTQDKNSVFHVVDFYANDCVKLELEKLDLIHSVAYSTHFAYRKKCQGRLTALLKCGTLIFWSQKKIDEQMQWVRCPTRLSICFSENSNLPRVIFPRVPLKKPNYTYSPITIGVVAYSSMLEYSGPSLETKNFEMRQVQFILEYGVKVWPGYSSFYAVQRDLNRIEVKAYNDPELNIGITSTHQILQASLVDKFLVLNLINLQTEVWEIDAELLACNLVSGFKNAKPGLIVPNKENTRSLISLTAHASRQDCIEIAVNTFSGHAQVVFNVTCKGGFIIKNACIKSDVLIFTVSDSIICFVDLCKMKQTSSHYFENLAIESIDLNSTGEYAGIVCTDLSRQMENVFFLVPNSNEKPKKISKSLLGGRSAIPQSVHCDKFDSKLLTVTATFTKKSKSKIIELHTLFVAKNKKNEKKDYFRVVPFCIRVVDVETVIFGMEWPLLRIYKVTEDDVVKMKSALPREIKGTLPLDKDTINALLEFRMALICKKKSESKTKEISEKLATMHPQNAWSAMCVTCLDSKNIGAAGYCLAQAKDATVCSFLRDSCLNFEGPWSTKTSSCAFFTEDSDSDCSIATEDKIENGNDVKDNIRNLGSFAYTGLLATDTLGPRFATSTNIHDIGYFEDLGLSRLSLILKTSNARLPKRWDVKMELLKNLEQWKEAADLAKKNDLESALCTKLLYAQRLAETGNPDKALEILGEAHVNDAAQILLQHYGKQTLVKKFDSQESTQAHRMWLARYLEAQTLNDGANALLVADRYFKYNDYKNSVRIYCGLGLTEEARKVAEASDCPAAWYILAQHYEKNSENQQPTEAVSMYAKAGCHAHALRIAKKHCLHEELTRLSLYIGRTDVIKHTASICVRKNDTEHAAELYLRAGEFKKALKIAVKHKHNEVLSRIVDSVSASSEKQELEECATILLRHVNAKHLQAHAVRLLALAGAYDRAVATAVASETLITGQVADLLPDAAAASAALALGQFGLAAKKFLQSGDRVAAVRALIRLGDTDKLVAFASSCGRSSATAKDALVLVANYLQSLDWQHDSGLAKHIVTFYTRARAMDHLASFYESCAQHETDEYSDYEKARAALIEAVKCLDRKGDQQKENEDDDNEVESIARKTRILDLRRRAARVQQFCDIRSAVADAAAISQQAAEEKLPTTLKICAEMLSEPGVQAAVRVGDIYALLVHSYHGAGMIDRAREVYQRMCNSLPPGSATEYLSPAVFKDLDIKTTEVADNNHHSASE